MKAQGTHDCANTAQCTARVDDICSLAPEPSEAPMSMSMNAAGVVGGA